MASSKHTHTLRERYGLDEATRPRGVLAAGLALLIRHAGLMFVIMMLLTVGAGYLASRLPLVTDFAQLIPQDTRSVRDQHAAEPYLGNTSLLVILIDARHVPAQAGARPGQDAARPEASAEASREAGERARQAAELLAARLRDDSEFSRVLHRFDREFFEHNALLYLSVDELRDLHARLDRRIEAEILAANPLFVDLDDDDDEDSGTAGQKEPDIFDPKTLESLYARDKNTVELREYLVNDAGTTYLVLAQPQKPAVDMAYNREVLDRVERHVAALGLGDRFDVEVSLAGNYRSAVEENDAVKRDLGQASIISTVLLLVILLLYFRRIRATWIIFIPLISSVVIMMGYAKLAVGRLNTITGFCFALFMGLSIDFAIHMLSRYDEERAQGGSVFDALLATYRETGVAAIAASLTTAAGFLALTAADFKGLKEFGIIAGGGIAICPIVIALELPLVIALSLRFARERHFVPHNIERILGKARPPRHGRIVLVGCIVIGLLAGRTRFLEWEGDFRELRGGPAETLRLAERFHEILGRSTQPAVRIAGSLDEAAALARACNDERARRGKDSTVQMCVSLADFIPDEQPAKLAIIAEIKGLLTDNRLEALDKDKRAKLTELRDNAPTAPITQADLPADIRQSFVSPAGDRYFMRAYPAVETWLVENNVRFADELMAGDDVSATDIGPVGTAMIMADLMRVMSNDSVRVVIIALAAVFLVLVIILRSVPRALASYVPLVAGLLCTAGLMEVMDIKLGFFNMIVIPSLIGMGVDANIYLLHRYHIEGRGSWRYVVNTTGGACAMATVTTMAGFSGLLVAAHLGLKTIGDLAILGMTTCLLISLTVLPAVMGWLESLLPGTGFGLLPAHTFVPPKPADTSAQDASGSTRP